MEITGETFCPINVTDVTIERHRCLLVVSSNSKPHRVHDQLQFLARIDAFNRSVVRSLIGSRHKLSPIGPPYRPSLPAEPAQL